MKLEIFIDKLFAKAKENGIIDCEVYFTEGTSFSVKVFNGEIDDYKNAKTHGLSFRGIVNEKMGYSYTEVFDEDALDMLINAVKENAGLIENDGEIEIFEGSESYEEIIAYNPELEKVTTETKIDFVKKLEEEAKKIDNRVQSVNYCLIGNSSGRRVIKNSKDLSLENDENMMYAYAAVVVKDGEDVKTGNDFIVSENFEDFDYKKIAKEAVRKAVDKLGAEPVASGEYRIIFENEAMGSIIETISGIFSAESVQKGLSQLKGKLGEEIAVQNFTLIDDPLMKKGYASRGFDDEGVATKSKNVIENGILKTYLHNLKTARKDGVESTGNGVKGSYKSSIGIAPSNFYLKPGDKSIEDIIKDENEAILITDLAGLHSGFNAISGDFSLLAEGFYIKDGKKEKPVNQITVAGNLFKMLKDIETIGSDLRFSLSAVGSPSVVVKGLKVAGK